MSGQIPDFLQRCWTPGCDGRTIPGKTTREVPGGWAEDHYTQCLACGQRWWMSTVWADTLPVEPER